MPRAAPFPTPPRGPPHASDRRAAPARFETLVPGGSARDERLPAVRPARLGRHGPCLPGLNSRRAAGGPQGGGAEFDFPDDSDAYIAYDDTLPPGGCEEGIHSEPLTTLKFDDLEGWRPFCIRSASGKDIAIVHLLDAPTASESVSVTVSLRCYRKTP
ncbi:hypothetical protein [Streptomyces sp. NPDC048641]|uniref:hypothetical protein n=1 Tax=Streptomyces sp. NPDC048641 TaxID=3154825 RepID=UPI00344A9CA5